MQTLYHFTSQHHLHGVARFGLTVGDIPTDIHRFEGRCGVWPTSDCTARGHGLEGSTTDKSRYRLTVVIPEGDRALAKWTEWAAKNATPATVRDLHAIANGFDTWYVYFAVIDPARIEVCVDMQTGLAVVDWRDIPKGDVRPVPPERRHVWHKKLRQLSS
jgi:hypothetical protein